MDNNLLRQRLEENNDIIDHVESIREIISRKCSRCNGLGCMGCLFDSVSLEMIPAMLDMILSLMEHLPNERQKVIKAAQSRHFEREETWREIERENKKTSKSLIEEFRQAFNVGDVKKLHTLRLDVIKETIQLAQLGNYVIDSKTITLPDAKPMMSGSILYSCPPQVSCVLSDHKTIVEVLDSDTLLAGQKLLNEGYNPAVLNFANRRTPGGGVLRGSGAQEENIFRRSNLFLSLYQFHGHGKQFNIPQRQEQYPLDRNTGGVYSPCVTVFRGLEIDGYPLLEYPYQLGVVTVAALNRPPLKDSETLADDMVFPTLQKIRTIFRIALLHGHDALVLGAWGCGAFKNPPQHIAHLFHEVMNEDEFRNKFRKIVFAVIDRKGIENTAGRNGKYEVFQAEFQNNPQDIFKKGRKSP